MQETNTGWAETTEQQVLDAALRIVPLEGWTTLAVTMAGRACGLSQGETELLLPHGAADLAALLSRRHDDRALAALGGTDPAALRIRERIARAVAARLDAAMADEAAARRLAGWFALPAHLPLAARLTWESADALWRWAGDTATDENHYSKRTLLAGILTGALAIRLASGPEAANAFVDRRIGDVMAFEKWKATTKLRPGTFVESLASAMGRIRYRA
jgi:ubiquinone biosynthesis protein COQ9